MSINMSPRRSNLEVQQKPQNIFMQDGAPIQNSKSNRAFLDKKMICLLSDWPLQSPDINIIEKMWAILKKNVGKQCPRNSEDLWTTVQKDLFVFMYSSLIAFHFRTKSGNWFSPLYVTSDQGNDVIFSDECQIKLFSSRRKFVRRLIGCRYLNKYVTKTVKFGGPTKTSKYFCARRGTLPYFKIYQSFFG